MTGYEVNESNNLLFDKDGLPKNIQEEECLRNELNCICYSITVSFWNVGS